MASAPVANASLAAILLVVKSTTEPRLVFHYPAKPGEHDPRSYKLLDEKTAEDGTNSSSDDESDASADDAFIVPEPAPPSPQQASPPDLNEVGSISPEKREAFMEQENTKQEVELFGHKTSVLAKLLCPNEATHKKRCEIGFAGKVFLGRPLFAEADGTWKKTKKRRSSSRSTEPKSNLQSVIEESKAKGPDEELVEIKEDEALEVEETEGSSESEEGEQNGKAEEPQFGETAIHVPEKPKHQLSMFHLCFVLDPPPLEYHQRVSEMWKYIVRPIMRALRYEQAKSEYVSTEAAIISSAVKRHRKATGNSVDDHALYTDLASESSLAKAIIQLFNNIVYSRHHPISFSSQTVSPQLPVPPAMESVPSPFSTQRPGMWLSTAPSMRIDPESQGPGSQLAAHFGLLLLTDSKSILADINPDAIRAELMARYVRVTKATKSFVQVSQASGIPLPQVLELATMLIQSRRGRAIPPLKQRDTYIVSPNADMASLSTASSIFAKTFPSLPSLPKILSLLSGTPKPYLTIVPSKDHKEVYINILAWLMQGCWVTQLRSFAWARVPAEVLERVHRSSEANGVANGNGEKGDSPGNEEEAPTRDSDTNEHVTPGEAAEAPVNPLPTTASSIVIPDPRHATADQVHYLAAISRHVHAVQGAESGAAWDSCVHYLDGKHALETIPIMQGWKNKKTFEYFQEWERIGILVRTRHW